MYSRWGAGRRGEVSDVRLWMIEAGRARFAGLTVPVDAAVEAIDDLVDVVGRGAVGAEVGAVVAAVLASAMEHGWQPLELARAAGRRGSARQEDMVATALAADREWNPRHLPPPSAWAAQLEILGVWRWWGDGADWLGPWATRSGIGWSAAVRVAIDVLGALSPLPTVERIVPPPSAWDGIVVPAGSHVDDAVLSTVRALLAKAESTQFEAEADALTAKAQQLMARHAIDEAVARGARHDPSERPSTRRTPVDDPYASAKSSLLHVVAGANGVRSIWYTGLALMALVGFEPDLDAVDVLFTSLLVQATRAMVDRGRVTDGRGHARTRSYRQSFLLSFAARIRERLAEAAMAARTEAEADLGVSLLPVLARRDDEVAHAVAEMFPRLRHGAGPVASNAEGWAAGRSAAETADLGPSGRLGPGRASA